MITVGRRLGKDLVIDGRLGEDFVIEVVSPISNLIPLLNMRIFCDNRGGTLGEVYVRDGILGEDSVI